VAVFGGSGALFDPVGAAGQHLRVQFLLDGEEHWLEVQGGKLVRADQSLEPDLVFTGTAAALFEINRGADLDGLADLTVSGSAAAKALFRRCFPPSDHLSGV
jgi:hypothetical protein